jgi:glucan phosphoethanolaminetransferase (alkaline phosphatase superfamily)
MKKTSIRQLYWFTMICHIFVLICGIATSVIMTINYNSFIESVGKIFGIIFLIFVIGLFIVLIFFSTKVIVILLKDFKSLKNNEYVSIVGKVLKFKRNREPESGVQINDKPIVLILDTCEEVELIVNDKIMVGETYKFNYLKNCKIAEVVEKL